MRVRAHCTYDVMKYIQTWYHEFEFLFVSLLKLVSSQQLASLHLMTGSRQISCNVTERDTEKLRWAEERVHNTAMLCSFCSEVQLQSKNKQHGSTKINNLTKTSLKDDFLLLFFFYSSATILDRLQVTCRPVRQPCGDSLVAAETERQELCGTPLYQSDSAIVVRK